MKTILEANGLWEMIEPTVNTVEDVKKDKAATAYLFQALPEELIIQVASSKSVKEVWDTLKIRHVGIDQVQKPRLQTIKTEFHRMQMKEDETIDSFTAKISSIVTRATSCDFTFDQPTLVRKLLNSIPDRFIQIVASIEQFTNLDTVTLDETIDRLSTFEERIKSNNTLWYLNNSASNHMTGNHEHFKEIDKNVTRQVCFGDGSSVNIKGKDEAWLWHALLGHLNFDSIKLITHKKMVQGIPHISHTNQVCDACLLGKHSRTPFPNQAKFISDEPLNSIYGDLCGPICHLLIQDFKLKVENVVGIKLKMLRTDRGGEFTSNEFTQFCKYNGIARQLTTPYSPQQNGMVERRNRTMLSTTRSMLKAMSMPQNFLAEAVRHTIYVLNRVPTKALTNCTPYEALKGMEEGSKVYRLFDPITKKICISRDVKFVEKDSWNWKDYMNDVGSDEPGWIDFVVNQSPTPITGNSEDEYANDEINESEQISSPNSPNTPFTPPTYTFEPNSMEVADFTSSSDSSARLFDHTPTKGFRSLDNVYERAHEIETTELLYSINKNNTWNLTDLPSNHKAIGLKWICKTKRYASGNIIKHKARSVAKGYVQQHGIDFDDVFAPVARIETVRLILALAAYNGWEVHHLDVKSAILHGELKEEVYVTQPEGFVKLGNVGKVYKLYKGLYGLRQTPRAWNVKLDQTLKSLDFKKFTGTPKKEIEHFKSQMKEKFEMSDLGLLAYYLGIEVTQLG
ncbi:hypothetical protein E3N88_23984 [Mikania micrantha]|uniref:Integrase catalytic domain-containing protein n=1 Tax=Mikania micrantha TaxID=192012 RepID=A0A5N6NGK5_9ASTR|nr:hypothetical protein E3N88_23984 [Mikania micrantha]